MSFANNYTQLCIDKHSRNHIYKEYVTKLQRLYNSTEALQKQFSAIPKRIVKLSTKAKHHIEDFQV